MITKVLDLSLRRWLLCSFQEMKMSLWEYPITG